MVQLEIIDDARNGSVKTDAVKPVAIQADPLYVGGGSPQTTTTSKTTTGKYDNVSIPQPQKYERTNTQYIELAAGKLNVEKRNVQEKKDSANLDQTVEDLMNGTHQSSSLAKLDLPKLALVALIVAAVIYYVFKK